MLDLVKNETERIQSRFLEPACGDGNFLIKILKRKLKLVEKKYKRNQFEYEKNSFLAISSLYGIDLLEDNIKEAKKRLYNIFFKEYQSIYKKRINQDFLKSVQYVLERNILQGDALSLKNKKEEPILFSQWSFLSHNSSKINREDFIFEEIIPKEKANNLFETRQYGDDGKEVFIPRAKKKYTPVNFLTLYQVYE
jgi:hypothetical protein